MVPAFWLVRWVTRGHLSVPTPYDLPALGLLALLPLALLPVTDWRLAAIKLHGIILGLALVYALANALRTRRRLLLATLATLLAVGTALVVVGIIGTQWSQSSKLTALTPLYSYAQSRLPLRIRFVPDGSPTGGMNPNEVGGVLALLLPLAVGVALLLLEPRGSWMRRLLAVPVAGVAAAMSLLLLLTQSRGALLGATIGLLLVASWWLVGGRRSARSRARGASSAGAAAPAVVVALAAAAAYVAWRLAVLWASSGQKSLESLGGRVEIWERSLQMLRDSPLTGVGLGQYPLVLSASYSPPWAGYVPHAHNFLLQLALDLGLPGALAATLLLLAFFRCLVGAYRRTRDRELRALAVSLGAGVVSYLVFGLADAIALGARGGLALWIVLGLGAALWRVSGESPSARTEPGADDEGRELSTKVAAQPAPRVDSA